MNRYPGVVRAYILAVIAAGGGALLVALPSRFEASEAVFFVALAVPGIVAGLYPLPVLHLHLRINLTGGILLMAVFLTNPSVACSLGAVVALVSGLALRRRPWNILFMASVNVLSIGLAAALYSSVADPALLPLDSWNNVLAFYLSTGAYWVVNSALVMVLVSARNAEPFFQAYVNNWREVYLQCILLTLLAVLGAAVWHQGVVYAFLLVVPAVVIYQLLSITRLKQEQVTRAIETIAEVLDRRNPFTFQHSRRVAEQVARVAKELGLSVPDVEVLRRAALIHDIGKLGVDDPSEELPPSRAHLTDYQFYNLKQHAQLGAMIAREIPAFEAAEQPIRYHHDWYDGSHASRPHAREEIPLGARVLAVADSYDRLRMANGDASLAYDPIAVEQLRAMAGTQLDPEILSRFLTLLEQERGVRPEAVLLARSPAR